VKYVPYFFLTLSVIECVYHRHLTI
jgi:hypothetical protein